jgi:acylphosphatase
LRKRAHAVIHGRVQGVFFRGDMRDRARSLGVAGWVRNNPDGTVEAVLEGEDDQLELLLSWCRRGPAGARVDDVDVDWAEPCGEGGFALL